MTNIQFGKLVSADRMSGDDEEDTELLKELQAEATAYIKHFKWRRGVKESFFGCGIGGVVAVFLFRVAGDPGVDEWLWVVAGDMPSAYFVTDRAPEPITALHVYCELMEQWVWAIQDGGDLTTVFPVAAQPTEEHAKMLESRIESLRINIIPVLSED